MNTMESLVTTCSPTFIEEVTLPAVMPYLASHETTEQQLLFEAAHSVMLAVVATPAAAEVSVKMLPFYVEAVFQVSE